ncbi:MAG: hypothetical protein IPK07_30620 [Deltaproteobacteria bacterium]|nr:hypothetical protein [Deltaproteobacteria bacterium]
MRCLDLAPCPRSGPASELRIPDAEQSWRIVYRIDPDVIVIVDIASKKTPPPHAMIEALPSPPARLHLARQR